MLGCGRITGHGNAEQEPAGVGRGYNFMCSVLSGDQLLPPVFIPNPQRYLYSSALPLSHIYLSSSSLNHLMPTCFKKKQCCSCSSSCQPCPCLHCRSCKLQPLPSFLCQIGEFSSLRLCWFLHQSHHRLSWSHTKNKISDYMERSSKKSDEGLTNGC